MTNLPAPDTWNLVFGICWTFHHWCEMFSYDRDNTTNRYAEKQVRKT